MRGSVLHCLPEARRGLRPFGKPEPRLTSKNGDNAAEEARSEGEKEKHQGREKQQDVHEKQQVPRTQEVAGSSENRSEANEMAVGGIHSQPPEATRPLPSYRTLFVLRAICLFWIQVSYLEPREQLGNQNKKVNLKDDEQAEESTSRHSRTTSIVGCWA